MPVNMQALTLLDKTYMRLDELSSLIRSAVWGAEVNPKHIHIADEPFSPQKLFVQSLKIPAASVKQARDASALQIGRLSPLPADEILWTLSRAESGGTDLAIIRKSEFAAQLSGAEGAETVNGLKFSDSAQREFIFRDNDMKLKRGRGIFLLSASLIAAYLALLWAMSQWTGYFENRAETYTRAALAEAKLAQSLETQILNEQKIDQQISGFAPRDDQRDVSTLFRALDDAFGVNQIEVMAMTLTGQNVTLRVQSPKPLELSKLEQSLKDWKVAPDAARGGAKNIRVILTRPSGDAGK